MHDRKTSLGLGRRKWADGQHFQAFLVADEAQAEPGIAVPSDQVETFGILIESGIEGDGQILGRQVKGVLAVFQQKAVQLLNVLVR